EGLARLNADGASIQLGRKHFRRASSPGESIGPEGAGLHRGKAWSVACMDVIRVQLALHQLAHEDRRAAVDPDADHVGYESLLEPRRQLRAEITHLIGVRENDVSRFQLPNQLREGFHDTIGRIRRTEVVLNQNAFVELSGAKLRAGSSEAGSGNRRQPRLAHLRCQLLPGSEGFPGEAMPAATPLQNHQYPIHIALTSNFRISASF